MKYKIFQYYSEKETLKNTVYPGFWIALGMAWHLDNGFFNIVADFLLGWVYVAYKLTERFW